MSNVFVKDDSQESGRSKDLVIRRAEYINLFYPQNRKQTKVI